MGMSQQAVEQHANNAVEAIADVYYYWSGHGEGYTYETEADLYVGIQNEV